MKGQLHLPVEIKVYELDSPKQLTVREMGVVAACDLNKEWHSRLPEIPWSNVTRNTHYVCYGAVYKSVYYAVGIWSSPVAQNRFENGKEILELRRLAIREEAPKYTATWMISKMIKDIRKRFPDVKRLISYQDTDVHDGTIYKAANWFIGNKTEYKSWDTNERERSKSQSKADKIRWEYCL